MGRFVTPEGVNPGSMFIKVDPGLTYAGMTEE